MASRISPEELVGILRGVGQQAAKDAGDKARNAARRAAGAGQKAFYDRIMSSALPHSKNPPGRVKSGHMRQAALLPRVVEDSQDRYRVAVGWPSPEDQRQYFLYQEEGTRFVKAMGALPLARVEIEKVLARETR